jgi:hypothetical protein
MGFTLAWRPYEKLSHVYLHSHYVMYNLENIDQKIIIL